MSILKLFQQNRKFIALIIVLGVVNSLMYSSLLFLINNGIRAEKDLSWMTDYESLIFLGIMIFSFLTKRIFQNKLLRFSCNILYDFTVSIINKIRHASFEAFRQLGNQRVFTAINDTEVVAFLPRFFVDTCNHIIVVICGLAYLLWTLPMGMFLTIAITGTLALFYRIRNRAIARDLNSLRDLQNNFYRYLGDLMDGFQQIKMSITRNDKIYWGFLEKDRRKIRDLDINTSIKYMDNQLFASYGWYVILGFVIFVMPLYQSVDYNQLTTFVVVILYLMGPIGFLVNSFDYLTRLNIAQNRLIEFDDDLGNLSTENNLREPLNIDTVEEIRFEDVYYTYDNKRNDRKFTLGPVNLTIEKGETLFVVGENGSGKSTFMMLLSGLIRPDSGRITINGQDISAKQMTHYRDLFSYICTDAHLFSEHYDDYKIDDSPKMWNRLLKMMNLEGVVKIDNLKQIADPNLSKGQQKRLLLMYALMEQKGVILLDEWAAEQDPSFRAIFYKDVLDELKAMGKTIIAITHDDRYFHHADRVITFYDGQLESIKRGKKSRQPVAV
ncbi:MAG: cyclic peptide export ABC transporter [Bacteroidota bacterium]